MKKTYMKPEIMFESFTLCTNIAAGCQFIVSNSSEGVCGYLDERDPTQTPVFTSKISGCKRHEADGGLNGICYHVPTDTSDLFNS